MSKWHLFTDKLFRDVANDKFDAVIRGGSGDWEFRGG
jgi:hypothetical protein